MVLLSITLGVPFHEVRTWSSAEISLYMAAYRQEPWGEYRGDLRNALHLKHSLEAAGAKKKGGGGFSLSDFMPFVSKPEPDAADVKDRMRSLFSRFRNK